MTSAAELLDEAARTLRRAELLLERAGRDLGAPFRDAIQRHAMEAASLRRRIGNAARTIGAGRGGARA